MKHVRHTPVGGASRGRTLEAYATETAHLLAAAGVRGGRARRLVLAHVRDVRRAWQKRQPPCAATDRILTEEGRGMHGRGRKLTRKRTSKRGSSRDPVHLRPGLYAKLDERAHDVVVDIYLHHEPIDGTRKRTMREARDWVRTKYPDAYVEGCMKACGTMRSPKRVSQRRRDRRFSRSPASGTITNVLGETRIIDRVYPDGSYNCPFCNYAVQAGSHGCQNPACSANPENQSEYARRRFTDVAERETLKRKEEASRREIQEFQKSYAAQRREEETAQIATCVAEAKRRGACVDCLLKDTYKLKYSKPKYVKHRTVCPLRKGR